MNNSFKFEKITCFETKFKSKIIKEVPKLYYCLKRIIINTKNICNSDELTYAMYYSLKEVFNNIKAINFSASLDINYYGYGFNEELINFINNTNISNTYGKELTNNLVVYFIKYKDNSVSVIIIDKNELDEVKDKQILTALKHIAYLANFNNTTIAA